MIIAVDPGKTTGIACLSDAGHFSAFAHSYDVALDYVMDSVTNIWIHPKLTVVIEDFIISERSGKTGTANWRRGMELEFIGAARWMCKKHDVRFVLQTAQQAKTFSTDAKLKRVGWWTKGTDHPRDAARHLLLYMTKNGLVDPTSLVG